jgi:hypothetical protein
VRERPTVRRRLSRVSPRGWLVRLATVVLVGSLAFGAWHVVVGGGLNGNGAAAQFGLALAAVSIVFLGGLRALDRRI